MVEKTILNLFSPEFLADPGSVGGGGGGFLGVSTPRPLNFIKREKMSRPRGNAAFCYLTVTRPPLLPRFPKSCIRPCTQPVIYMSSLAPILYQSNLDGIISYLYSQIYIKWLGAFSWNLRRLELDWWQNF